MRRCVLTTVGVIFLLSLLALAGSAGAADNTYTVNATSYTNDGSCDPLASGDCTLWEAIQMAVVDAGVDTIAFDIPITDVNYGHNTAGVWTIVLTGTLQSPVGNTVDGTTQATSILSDTNPYGPEIEISGEGLPGGGDLLGDWIERHDQGTGRQSLPLVRSFRDRKQHHDHRQLHRHRCHRLV